MVLNSAAGFDRYSNDAIHPAICAPLDTDRSSSRGELADAGRGDN